MPLVRQLRGLRQLPDEKRAAETKEVALAIRQLPASSNKLMLANNLANPSTEGDFGHDTLQEVATTLATALREQPLPASPNQLAMPYKEMPDLEALYQELEDRSFLILAITDEDISKVQLFIAQQHITYPILLDPGRKVNALFQVEGIPQSYVYGRDGKLVTQPIDMRTRKQFLEMLGHAGLH